MEQIPKGTLSRPEFGGDSKCLLNGVGVRALQVLLSTISRCIKSFIAKGQLRLRSHNRDMEKETLEPAGAFILFP